MTESGISEEEVRKVVADKDHYPVDMSIDAYPDKFVTGWLIKYWPQIVELIDAGRANKNS